MTLNSLKSLYIVPKFNEINLASATGFVVEKNNNKYLITNRHVVTGKNNITNDNLDPTGAIPNKLLITVPIIHSNGASWTCIEINLYDTNDKPLWLEHPIYKNNVDVVAIPLYNFNYNNLAYPVESTPYLEITDTLFIIGYPYSYKVLPGDKRVAIWTMGTVASEPELNLNINNQQLPAFLVDAKTRSGQSGSPVIYYNNTGFIKNSSGFGIMGNPVSFEVGIYSGRINKDSDLGFVWKWSNISEIISQN